MADFEWNDATLARLRALWAEELSTAKIGCRLGVSKNAVVGKAHRLGLPPRPSPIRRLDEPRAAQTPRAPKITLPELLADPLAAPNEAAQVVQLPETTVTWFGERKPMGAKGRRFAIRGATLAPLRSAAPAKVPAPAPVVVAAREACRWPMWADTGSYRDAERAGEKLFCGDPVRMKCNTDGNVVPCVYCAEHAKIAFVHVRDMREVDTMQRRGHRLHAKSIIEAERATAWQEMVGA